MAVLQGVNPGPWCSAYHKSKDRAICADRRCKFYQNHVITISSGDRPNDEVPDVDDDLNAVSIEKPVIRAPRVNYHVGVECDWHCCRFDKPSELETLPWE